MSYFQKKLKNFIKNDSFFQLFEEKGYLYIGGIFNGNDIEGIVNLVDEARSVVSAVVGVFEEVY